MSITEDVLGRIKLKIKKNDKELCSFPYSPLGPSAMH
jgi:hypothetical protein